MDCGRNRVNPIRTADASHSIVGQQMAVTNRTTVGNNVIEFRGTLAKTFKLVQEP